MYRPGSSAGILNTIQVPGISNGVASNIIGSNVPTNKFVNLSRQYGVGGTLGATTIEYDDPTSSSALGFFPAPAAPMYQNIGPEDLEAHILMKNAN